MSKPIKVGVIGCGGVAQMMHLPFLADHPDLFQLEAVCDVNPLALDAVATRYHVPHRFTDDASLLALPLDAVLVLSADPHSPQVIAAAQQGKHILVEKPLAFNLREVDMVERAVREAGVQLMVAYMKRYDPAYVRAREILAGRTDLRHVEITVWHPDDAAYRTHYQLTPPPALYDPVASAGGLGIRDVATQGVLAELVDEALGRDAPLEQRMGFLMMITSIIHQVNAMRGILGEPEAVLATHIWHDACGIHTTFRFSAQLLATLTWVFLPGIRHYQETYRFLAPDLRLELEFPSPYLRHFPTALRIEGADGSHAWKKDVVVSFDEAFHAELRHFHHCVVTGERPRTGIEEARRDTEWLIAMARAYRPS